MGALPDPDWIIVDFDGDSTGSGPLSCALSPEQLETLLVEQACAQRRHHVLAES